MGLYHASQGQHRQQGWPHALDQLRGLLFEAGPASALHTHPLRSGFAHPASAPPQHRSTPAPDQAHEAHAEQPMRIFLLMLGLTYVFMLL